MDAFIVDTIPAKLIHVCKIMWASDSFFIIYFCSIQSPSRAFIKHDNPDEWKEWMHKIVIPLPFIYPYMAFVHNERI